MKQKTKDIIGALLLGLLCTLALSAVITVADTETARTDLMIGMQYETTGLDLDAAPGLLVGLVKLHQNFPLDAWAWGPAAAGLAALLYWVRRQRTAKPRCAELVLSIVFGVAEVLGLSICKLGSWGRERCHNTAGNVVCRQTAVGQGLTGGGDGQRGGILVFGAVIALADAGAGRDPFIAGVHLPAQILVRHHTVGQGPTGSQQL